MGYAVGPAVLASPVLSALGYVPVVALVLAGSSLATRPPARRPEPVAPALTVEA
ncbi:hypothetical protein AB2L28_19430 [Kineococcus sp. TBRC 1896]|uniref:MFS transporter n=1 Tax=Kineococcus mangrovi TaxID=1660183 RepID=A0ABV4I798_9ACTN